MTILFKEVRFIIDGWRSEVGERIHQLVNIAFLSSWRYLSLLPLSLQRVWQKPLVFDSREKFIDSWLLLRLYPTKRSRNFFFFFFSHTCAMWKFPGRGSNHCHSYDLPPCATAATAPDPQPTAPTRELPVLHFGSFTSQWWGIKFFFFLILNSLGIITFNQTIQVYFYIL